MVMLQSIEKQQEKRKSPSTVTVMFHDRSVILGDFDSFFSRARACEALSGSLAVTQIWGADGLSLSLPLKVCLKNRQINPLARSASLSPSKKVFVEQLVERSARLVCEAPVTTRGMIAASSIEQKTEQRCCIAA
jgi:hypothetical protein